MKRTLLGKQLVVYLTATGTAVVLDDRCVHMGARLSGGCVVGETIQCPLHHWQFGADGRCRRIPSGEEIPGFARQASYPAQQRGGQIYFFNGPEAHFPLPFFDGLTPDDLAPGKPFVEQLDCPWYMVGANAVDVQHFAIAHDRRMIDRPEVDYPSPYAHRTVCRFQVEGDTLADRLTRRFGGPTVTLTVTDWSSTILFAHSQLQRSETVGMVCMVPIDPHRTRVHVTVMARRSGQRWRQVLLDPIRARIRRALIRRFLRADVDRLGGTVYSQHTLIAIDQQFAEYFSWIAGLLHTGGPR